MNKPLSVAGVLYNAYEPVEGRSDEALSERAVETAAEQAASALVSQGVRAPLFPLKQSLRELIDWVQAESPDVVVNLCEGFRGQPRFEANVAGVLELLEVPFTGNPARALFQCQDKFGAKSILQAAGLPVPQGWLVATPDELPAALPYPLMVKPNAEDASIGIDSDSVVSTPEALAERVRQVVRRYRQDALVEAYIDGREFNVGVVDDPAPRALPVSEIVFEGFPAGVPRIVSYAAKWKEDHDLYRRTVPSCPAVLAPDLAAALQALALRAYRVMQLRGYARIDFRLDARERPFILEVNPNPDASRTAGLARAWMAGGRPYEEFWMSQLAAAVSGRRN